MNQFQQRIIEILEAIQSWCATIGIISFIILFVTIFDSIRSLYAHAR